jgi:signal transduction histidine kinase
MFQFRTLTRRFGSLYSVVIVFMVAVGTIATMQLRHIQLDSKRVMEESRELMIITQLISEIDSLEVLLETSAGIEIGDFDRTVKLLRASIAKIRKLEDHPDDPSSAEHRLAEAQSTDDLVQHLCAVDVLLGDPLTLSNREQAAELLAASRQITQVLYNELEEEALEAGLDLELRADRTRLVLLLSLFFALLLLGAALTLMHRGVVQPIRHLSAGAERFGRGDLKHRILLKSNDEIGDLASSFNAMADRLAKAHTNLEERVKKRTREFIRAARLADLGILASGVAHEINTPLASIASSAEGLRRKIEGGQLHPRQLKRYSQTICDEAFRAREITTRMLGLVRHEPGKLSKVSLQLIMHQAESALRHRAESADISLVQEPVSEHIFLTVNGGELVQILVILLANALDASRPGGRVTLKANALSNHLVVDVVDEGRGISDEDLDRIFEPFYTTKKPGEGTGLGLALAGSMVESHRGRISVNSRVEKGSVFTVTLPRDWGLTQ